MTEELRKRMAEFAGFELVTCIHETELYKHPRLPENSFYELPDFPNDLNACTKWLVPQGDIEKIIFTYFSTWLTCDVRLNSGERAQGVAMLGQEALALCLAIDKLIDEKKG